MAVLILAEHDGQALAGGTLNTITAAKALDGEVHALIAGHECRAVAEGASHVEGVSKVLIVDHETYAHPVAEDLAALVLSLAHGYQAILTPSTTFGRNVMPRVAAELDVAQLSDVTEVISPDTFKRYFYAGNALATVQTTDAVKVITVRTTAFDPAVSPGGSATIEARDGLPPTGLASYVGSEVSKGERPDLTSARIVVSGGRGVGSSENFSIIEACADALGAAVGASRAAVDAGFVPNEYQVGQTGKIVAPDLYVAVGISGAIQHLAGMKDSKVIVAINKDDEAPIFQVADYGLVADLFQAVPELTESLKQG